MNHQFAGRTTCLVAQELNQPRKSEQVAVCLLNEELVAVHRGRMQGAPEKREIDMGEAWKPTGSAIPGGIHLQPAEILSFIAVGAQSIGCEIDVIDVDGSSTVTLGRSENLNSSTELVNATGLLARPRDHSAEVGAATIPGRGEQEGKHVGVGIKEIGRCTVENAYDPLISIRTP
jgi:hypothetical protein